MTKLTIRHSSATFGSYLKTEELKNGDDFWITDDDGNYLIGFAVSGNDNHLTLAAIDLTEAV